MEEDEPSRIAAIVASNPIVLVNPDGPFVIEPAVVSDDDDEADLPIVAPEPSSSTGPSAEGFADSDDSLSTISDVRYYEEPVPVTVMNNGPLLVRHTLRFLHRVRDENSERERNRTRASTPDTIITSEDSNSLPALPRPEETVAQEKDNTAEPPAKMRKVGSPTPANEDIDGEMCPICLDSWSNTGEHRLASLKCGHLFGANCVERWLRGKGTKDRMCPTCKSKASVKDIRFIYAKRLVAMDMTEIVMLQKQIEVMQAEKTKVEFELQTVKIEKRALTHQLDMLRKTLLKAQLELQQPSRRGGRFALEKNLEMCKDGGCRVLTFNCRTYEFYVSQKSTNSLFSGYGIRKINCVDYKPSQFVHLHAKPIRDIVYSHSRDLLMTVALDSSVRILERGILSQAVVCTTPLWSCTWDWRRENEFYVGGVGGVIMHYDLRNTSVELRRMSSLNDMSPVVSLRSTEFGLLSCQLNTCGLWPTTSVQQYKVPAKGPFVSMCYDDETHRMVASSRATSITERARLTVYKLRPVEGGVSFDVEQQISGSSRSSFMSRCAWVKYGDGTWVAAHSESDQALYLHGVDGSRTSCLPAAEPSLDVCSAGFNGETMLAALSETRLRLYKSVPTTS